MTRYQRHHWFLAVALAALAGFVDAIGFLYTGGFFTAFMTGNSTRMAVGLFTDGTIAAIAADDDRDIRCRRDPGHRGAALSARPKRGCR